MTHAYWNYSGYDEAGYANWFTNQCKTIWNNTGRPVWLSEMEVGASWGNKFSDYESYRKYVQVLLQKIEECDFIERYVLYATDYWVTYLYYDANPSKDLTPAGEVYRDHRSTFAYHAKYTKDPVWWTPGLKKPSISVTYNADRQSADFYITNENTDMTNRLVIELSSDGSEWKQVLTYDERSSFDESDIEILGHKLSGVTMGTLFRVTVTTLTNATSTSDTFQLGGIINGNIEASSKSSIKGWTCVRGAQNGYTKADSGDTYFEAWHPTAEGMSFDYYQDLNGLQNGVYRLQANVFNSTNNVATATINGAVGLYAQNGNTTWFTPVTKDSNLEDADLLTLDKVIVTDGTLRIGVRNIREMTARWAGADNFAITYLGDVDEVLGMEEDEALAAAQAAFLEYLTPVGDNAYDLSFFLHNPEATSSTDGWKTSNVKMNSGEAYDKVNTDPKNTYFDQWSASSYSSSMEQTIQHLPAGEYELRALLRGSASFPMTLSLSNGTQTRKIAFTGKGDADNEHYPKGWEEVALEELTVGEKGTLTIALTGTGSSWWSADHFTLIYYPEREPEPQPEPQPNGLAFSTNIVQAKMGEDVVLPTLSNPYDLPLTWESDEEEVAIVDDEGNVTLVGPGTAIISAAFAGNDDYLAGKVSYTIFVEKADPVPNGLAFSSDIVQAKMGEDVVLPTLSNPYELTLTWSSEDEEVATVDNEGNVTLVGPGTTIISATFAGNDDYLAGTVSYSLHVAKADPVPNGLAFSTEEATARMGEDFELPAFSNPNSLPVTWTSSETSVATVDDEGNVTLVGPGTTIISAAFAGNDDYLAGTVSYTLTVQEPDGIAHTTVRKPLHIYTYSGTPVSVSPDTNGRFLPSLRKGTYIVNGRKVIIK